MDAHKLKETNAKNHAFYYWDDLFGKNFLDLKKHFSKVAYKKLSIYYTRY